MSAHAKNPMPVGDSFCTGAKYLLSLLFGARSFVLSSLLLAIVGSVSANEGNIIVLDDRSRARDAAGQLIRSQLPSGFFPYDFNFSNGAQSDMDNVDGINLVRQADAAFSLAEYHAAFPGKETRQSLELFLLQAADASLPIGKSALQQLLEQAGLYNRWQLWRPLREPLYSAGLLFSKEGNGKLVSVAGDYERAWPGATALSLIAAIKLFRETGDPQFNAAIQWWKNGLFALHVPGRGLREAPHYLTESAYVNGEAWLALAEYVKSFPTDQEALVFLHKLDTYMLETYGEKPNKLFYSWGTMAAAVRATSTRDPRFVAFMVKLATFYLQDEETRALEEINSCASVEGLATFVGLMKNQGRENEPIVSRAIHSIERLMPVNRKLQINANSINVLNVDQKYLSRLNDYQGAFIYSLQEPLMQVDLTGHCINALVRMDQAGLR